MKTTAVSALVLAMSACFSSTAIAQQKDDLGKREFEVSCAVCHGTDAKGSGSYAPLIKSTPPDLTTLAKKNNGVFPINYVYEVIDGRKEIAVHGQRDMPIWGNRYSERAAEEYSFEGERFVRNRILLLVDYLYRLQQK
jgi:mono/diheme cytochrome c family protein